jgi:hypothetical protein
VKPIRAKDLGLLLPAGGGKAKPGLGALPKPRMNQLESAYAAQLDLELRQGLILWWRFEGITLKLGDDCRYTPDFAVLAADGVLELRETKGFMRDDARVKLKVAAASFPFRCWLIRKDGGGFNVEAVTP